MSELAIGEVEELAARQVSIAARFGIGHELAAVTEALAEDEHPLVIATGFVDGAFGVLTITARRVIWAACGEGEIALRTIRLADVVGITALEPERCGARLVARDPAESLEVEQVIPTDAVRAMERLLAGPPRSAPGRDVQPA